MVDTRQELEGQDVVKPEDMLEEMGWAMGSDKPQDQELETPTLQLEASPEKPEAKVEEIKPTEVEPTPAPTPETPEPAPAPVTAPVSPETQPQMISIGEYNKLLEDVSGLRNQLAQVQAMQPQVHPQGPPQPVQGQPQQPQAPQRSFKEVITPELWHEIASSPEAFAGVLDRVYQAATSDIMLMIPSMIQTNVHLYNSINKITEEFYAANKDLLPYRQTVATIAQEIINQNPNTPIGTILEQAAPEARRRLRLPATVVVHPAPTSPKPTKPALPGSGTVTPRPKASKSLPEQDALIATTLGSFK